MSIEELIKKINLKRFEDNEYSKIVINAVRDRCETLNDFPIQTDYFFNDPEVYDQILINKHCSTETYSYLTALNNNLNAVGNWEQSRIKEVIDKVASDLDVGFGKIGLPLRLALTATTNSPSIDLVCEILGKEKTLKRLDSFLITIKNQEKNL